MRGGFYSRGLKRALDFLAAGVLLTLLLPLFALVAFLIKLDSRGPVFYLTERMGKGGKRFRMFKFRTMTEEASKQRPRLATKDDPRVTRIGRVLRPTKLDELPQLFNVLRGEMSLVGPRPHVPHLYHPEGLPALPGITGLSQIIFRWEERMSLWRDEREYIVKVLPLKALLDRYYAHHSSLWLDLKILAWTVRALLSRRPIRPHFIRRIIEEMVEEEGSLIQSNS